MGSVSGRARSKIRSFFSWPPVRTYAPELAPAEVEGERATVRTMWLWAKVWRTEPVYVSQILQVKSAEAVAAREVSGLSLDCQTAPLWPNHREEVK